MTSAPPAERSVWVHAGTHPGSARPTNEDTLGCTGWSAQGTVSLISHHYAGDAPVVCVVADGLGGHRAGHVASALVVRRLVHGHPPENVKELVEAIEAAHDEVLGTGQASPRLAGMATTIAVLVATADTVLCANVGDSRVYEISNGSALHVSFDDKPDGPAGDDRVSTITQALGGARPSRPDPHPQWFAREPELTFLLCSDGVTNLVTDQEIGALVNSSAGDADGVRNLLDACLKRGAPDNVTALLVRIDQIDKAVAADPGPGTDKRAASIEQGDASWAA
jgi:serine/threonine protein phosphatase PrpC